MNHPPLPPDFSGDAPPAGGPPLPGVRLPRQARSRASFDRMVDSALDLIAERGLEGATVQEILARSGVGAGTFYARFDSRDALFAYLTTRFWEDALHGWETVLAPGRWSAASVREIVTQFTRMLVLWSPSPQLSAPCVPGVRHGSPRPLSFGPHGRAGQSGGGLPHRSPAGAERRVGPRRSGEGREALRPFRSSPPSGVATSSHGGHARTASRTISLRRSWRWGSSGTSIGPTPRTDSLA